jgi:hypothetical protein
MTDEKQTLCNTIRQAACRLSYGLFQEFKTADLDGYVDALTALKAGVASLHVSYNVTADCCQIVLVPTDTSQPSWVLAEYVVIPGVQRETVR